MLQKNFFYFNDPIKQVCFLLAPWGTKGDINVVINSIRYASGNSQQEFSCQYPLLWRDYNFLSSPPMDFTKNPVSFSCLAFFVFANPLWSQEFSLFASFVEASLSSSYRCSGGYHWEPEPSTSLETDPGPSGREGSPALSPQSPSAAASSRCFRGSCGYKSNLQLWLCSSSIWQSAV